ncbi:MAG: hypothetical protein MHM6MM_005774 [Cercozoa sp. M6MM]
MVAALRADSALPRVLRDSLSAMLEADGVPLTKLFTFVSEQSLQLQIQAVENSILFPLIQGTSRQLVSAFDKQRDFLSPMLPVFAKLDAVFSNSKHAGTGSIATSGTSEVNTHTSGGSDERWTKSHERLRNLLVCVCNQLHLRRFRIEDGPPRLSRLLAQASREACANLSPVFATRLIFSLHLAVVNGVLNVARQFRHAHDLPQWDNLIDLLNALRIFVLSRHQMLPSFDSARSVLRAAVCEPAVQLVRRVVSLLEDHLRVPQILDMLDPVASIAAAQKRHAKALMRQLRRFWVPLHDYLDEHPQAERPLPGDVTLTAKNDNNKTHSELDVDRLSPMHQTLHRSNTVGSVAEDEPEPSASLLKFAKKHVSRGGLFNTVRARGQGRRVSMFGVFNEDDDDDESSLAVPETNGRRRSIFGALGRGTLGRRRYVTPVSSKNPATPEEGVEVRLTLWHAEGLPVADVLSKSCDPYVVLRVGKRTVHSSVRRKTLSPVFCEQLRLRLSTEQATSFSQRHVEVELWDRDKLGDDDFLCSQRLLLERLKDSPLRAHWLNFYGAANGDTSPRLMSFNRDMAGTRGSTFRGRLLVDLRVVDSTIKPSTAPSIVTISHTVSNTVTSQNNNSGIDNNNNNRNSNHHLSPHRRIPSFRSTPASPLAGKQAPICLSFDVHKDKDTGNGKDTIDNRHSIAMCSDRSDSDSDERHDDSPSISEAGDSLLPLEVATQEFGSVRRVLTTRVPAEAAAAEYELALDIYEVADVDNHSGRCRVDVDWGGEKLQSHVVTCKRGSARWHRQFRPLLLRSSSDVRALPDIIVSVCLPHRYSSGEQRISYVRIPAWRVLQRRQTQTTPQWRPLTPAVMQQVKAPRKEQQPGFVLLRCAVRRLRSGSVATASLRRPPLVQSKLRRFTVIAHIFEVRNLPLRPKGKAPNVGVALRVAGAKCKTRVLRPRQRLPPPRRVLLDEYMDCECDLPLADTAG